MKHTSRIPSYPVSERERWISVIGGFICILLVMVTGQMLDTPSGHLLIIAPIGASAVLAFAIPHGAMSQPWPILGGHLASATVGIACAKWIANPTLAGPMAVGLAIAVMYSLRCLHPPGGATALFTVIGGADVRTEGFDFILNPVLPNVLVLLSVAFLYNLPFSWRRYPARLAARLTKAAITEHEKCHIPHSQLVYALSQLDTFIDITEEDLQRIYNLALNNQAMAAKSPERAD